MFWCHGGAWSGESGSWPWINGESLSRRGDVVVVTINHRINVFGFCHLGMVFDNICRMVNDPGSKERKFWQSL